MSICSADRLTAAELGMWPVYWASVVQAQLLTNRLDVITGLILLQQVC